MKAFATLIQKLGSSTATNDKIEALSTYFAEAHEKDRVWVIALFSGRRPKRVVNSTLLSQWCIELTNLPQWLYEESYHTVGDLAETIALLLPPATDQGASWPLHMYLEKFLSLEKALEADKKAFIVSSWMSMSQDERFVFNKFITGGFRIGVSQKTMVNALARTTQLPDSVIAHRISGNWDPATTDYSSLLSEEAAAADISKPYPFYLAYALEDDLSALGAPSEWQAEWKWDGIRGQLIKRNDQLFTWSRGEELITDKFPEYGIFRELLPNGIVLDGEILPFDGSKPLPFSILQTRIGRKNVTRKQLQEAPAALFVYDLLEFEGNDFREQPLAVRRQKLEEIVNTINHPILQLSPAITFTSWDELANHRNNARELGSEGLMIKRLASMYQTGRKRGDWWKWKIDPLVIDCVMVYAMKGHGRRSNLYTDYTFAVRDGDQLVTFTKAYSGLTDEEFRQVDHFVKNNSIEKFGPVRTVKPELVFEIAFEGIAASNRHKSGVALRFPRMSRWRKDKKADEINTLDDLKKMLELYGK